MNAAAAAAKKRNRIATVQPVIYTVDLEYVIGADKEWSASVHRPDGTMLTVIAGASAYDVLGEAAKAIDKAAEA